MQLSINFNALWYEYNCNWSILFNIVIHMQTGMSQKTTPFIAIMFSKTLHISLKVFCWHLFPEWTISMNLSLSFIILKTNHIMIFTFVKIAIIFIHSIQNPQKEIMKMEIYQIQTMGQTNHSWWVSMCIEN